MGFWRRGTNRKPPENKLAGIFGIFFNFTWSSMCLLKLMKCCYIVAKCCLWCKQQMLTILVCCKYNSQLFIYDENFEKMLKNMLFYNRIWKIDFFWIKCVPDVLQSNFIYKFAKNVLLSHICNITWFVHIFFFKSRCESSQISIFLIFSCSHKKCKYSVPCVCKSSYIEYVRQYKFF